MRVPRRRDSRDPVRAERYRNGSGVVLFLHVQKTVGTFLCAVARGGGSGVAKVGDNCALPGALLENRPLFVNASDAAVDAMSRWRGGGRFFAWEPEHSAWGRVDRGRPEDVMRNELLADHAAARLSPPDAPFTRR